MKILLYQLLPKMESHLLPPMLSILLTAEIGIAKGIETGTGMVVSKGTPHETGIGTGTGTGIVIMIVIEGQTTITTRNHGGESMNETTITKIEAMIGMPNHGGMTMNTVLGIVTVTVTGTGIGKSAIGTGRPDQTEKETETGIGRGIGTETEATETETEETGRGGTGRGGTGREETGREETGKRKGTGRGIEETERDRETERKEPVETKRNLIHHEPRHLMNPHLLRRQRVTLLDPSSKKYLLPTLTATVLYLRLQTQALDLVDGNLDCFVSSTPVFSLFFSVVVFI